MAGSYRRTAWMTMPRKVRGSPGEAIRGISPDQERGRGARRHAAMAHAVLDLGRELAERAAQRRVEEQRVVAEAAGAARRLDDPPLHDALHHTLAAARLDQRDDAAEARGPALGG